MTKFQFWQVDAFTNQPFRGNPAAVFIHHEPLEDALMQNIAVEMNLSETAFIHLKSNAPPMLRWFTPMYEIDLCGHATLAAAYIYFNEVDKNAKSITFETKYVGDITVNNHESSLTMNFPSRPGEEVHINQIPNYVLNGLSTAKPMYARQSRDLMLVYRNENDITSMTPDFTALKAFKKFIIVTAESQNINYDFISRFFCADDGISEDPVTGSAHCTLAPYWANKLNKHELLAYQASKRGGELSLKVHEDTIEITGKAILLIRGELMLP